MENLIQQHRLVYVEAMAAFFMAFAPETRKKIKDDLVTTADDTATNLNWYLGAPTVIKTGLWDVVRSDVNLHVALIKFERILFALASLHATDSALLAALDTMLNRKTSYAKDIVDKDFIDTNVGGVGFSVDDMPGVPALLSIILFRDLWAEKG